MLNHKGEVAECTGDNIFVVRGGRLLTPPTEAGILEGITREAVMELAVEAGICVRETPLTKHDVYIADECFLTGTAAEVVPVVKVDSRTIGDGTPGPITRELIGSVTRESIFDYFASELFDCARDSFLDGILAYVKRQSDFPKSLVLKIVEQHGIAVQIAQLSHGDAAKRKRRRNVTAPPKV